MHEYSIVQAMVERIVEGLREHPGARVTGVRVRRGSTFSEGALRQAWEMLAPGTPLAEADLHVEEFGVDHTCAGCGEVRRLGEDDLIGHVYVCLHCGAASDIDEAHGLEVEAVTIEGTT